MNEKELEDLLKRLSKYLHLFGSDNGDERAAAFQAMQRSLTEKGLSFSDIRIARENNVIDPMAVEKKYTEEQAHKIFAQGCAKGAAEEAAKQWAPPEFYDADNRPRWYEMARYCKQNERQLRDDWEREFIPNMVARMAVREPTEKQGRHLLTIFIRLGGPYDPKTCNLPW
jgi:hypothetical protein